MKKLCAALAICSAFFFAGNAFANSSWIWISKTRPVDVLPWVAACTILIEWLFLGKAIRSMKCLGIVSLANIASFLAPFIVNILLYQAEGFDYIEYLEHYPSYIVGAVYASVTIAIELPIVYHLLKKTVPDRKKLMGSIVIANIITTVLVAVVERLVCRGRW